MEATDERNALISFLDKIGLSNLVELAKTVPLNSIVEESFTKASDAIQAELTEEQLTKLYKYEIPLLSEDGTCSKHGLKEEKPFDLSEVYSISWSQLKRHHHTLRLLALNNVVQTLYDQYNIDWVGLYRKMSYKKELTALYKEAYRGEISRPIFPLTDDFAQISNNSTVGMTGKAVVIQDVAAYAGPYYECSTKVLAEICAPIIAEDGDIIGIIDAESWKANFFTPELQIQILKVCSDLGRLRLYL